MLDGATPAPLQLLLLWLIAHGELSCLLHVDETCLKLYSWTIVHPTLPCKSVLINLLFLHFLLVEGSQLIDIVSLIIRLVLISDECFGLQELFKGLGCLYPHQIEHLFPIFLEPKHGDPYNARDPIV